MGECYEYSAAAQQRLEKHLLVKSLLISLLPPPALHGLSKAAIFPLNLTFLESYKHPPLSSTVKVVTPGERVLALY